MRARMELAGAVADCLPSLGALVLALLPAVHLRTGGASVPGGKRPRSSDDDRLPHPPPALRHPDSDRGEPDHLRPVLRRQHAGRHGAHAARASSASRRRRSSSWKVERGYDKPLFYQCRGATASAGSPTRFSCRSRLRMFAFDFGRPRSTAATSAMRSAPACGPAWRSRCRCSWSACWSTSRFALLMAFFRGTYLDFAGVVLCVIADVGLRSVLHHRRPVPDRASCGTWCRSRAMASGLSAMEVPGAAGGHRRRRRHRQRARAGTAPSSSKRWQGLRAHRPRQGAVGDCACCSATCCTTP